MRNRISIFDLVEMTAPKIALLGVGDLLNIQEDIDEYKAKLGELQLTYARGLLLKFSTSEQEVRNNSDKPVGKVNMDVEGYKVSSDVTKRVSWNQDKLRIIAAELHKKGENPQEYIDFTMSVRETAYKSWPTSISSVFLDARTVSHSPPKFSISSPKE